MATATMNTTRPATRARLTINIDGVDYRVRPFHDHDSADGEWGIWKAYRLTRVDDGQGYTVARQCGNGGRDSITCTCPKWTQRGPGPCRHAAALVALELLDADGCAG